MTRNPIDRSVGTTEQAKAWMIEFLLDQKFGKLIGPLRYQDSVDLRAYEAELDAKPIAEILKLWQLEQTREKEKERQNRENQEAQRFLNRPDASADLEFWAKAAYWTLDEAVALSFGKDPEAVKWESVASLVEISPFAKDYSRRRELTIRAKIVKQLYDPVLPVFFFEWAKANGIEYPKELEVLVTARGGALRDWNSAHDESFGTLL